MDPNGADFDFDEAMKKVEETLGNMSKADSSSSEFSFEFVEDFDDDVEKYMSAENSSEPESEGVISDFDLCDEYGRVVICSASEVESVKSSKAEYSSGNSESESDDIKSKYSSDSIRSMDIEVFGNVKMQLMREILSFPEYPYHELMTAKEFKEMRLRDIVKEHALPFLPAKSLARFRSVSKSWDRWIKNPFLAHKQSYTFQNMSGYFHERFGTITFVSLCQRAYGISDSFFSFLPNLSIVCSCNGLLLCRTRDGSRTYHVCNPATNEWKELPQPCYYHGEDSSIVLAFEPSILNMGANYHLVCAFQMLDEPVLSFEIYSSETNSWKCVDSLCAELGDSTLVKNGFYFNGVVYWETTSNEVLAFDLKNEVHGVLPLLDRVVPAGGGALSRMKGELCYVRARNMMGGVFEVSVYVVGVGGGMDLEKRVCFWLMVSDYDECRVLPCLGDDVVMLLVDGGIYACNLDSKKVEVVMRGGNLDSNAMFLPYVNSLVSVA